MAVDANQVRHVAALARLSVDDQDLDPLVTDLNAILSYVDRLDAADVPEAPADARPGRRRDDEPRTWALEPLHDNAPAFEDDLFEIQLPAAGPLKPEITIDDFGKLDLRTGRILTVERHPKGDRLLVLSVDLAEGEPRTIVAGLAPYYDDPQVLVDRTVIVVANLKPVVLRGITSYGMLLAAGGKNHHGTVTVTGGAPAGEPVR